MTTEKFEVSTWADAEVTKADGAERTDQVVSA